MAIAITVFDIFGFFSRDQARDLEACTSWWHLRLGKQEILLRFLWTISKERVRREKWEEGEKGKGEEKVGEKGEVGEKGRDEKERKERKDGNEKGRKRQKIEREDRDIR